METKKKTPTFKDADGRPWMLRFTLGNAREIQDTIGVDFNDIQSGALIAVANDLSKLASLLWILCESQADRAGVDEIAFARSLDGDAIDRAVEALQDAIVNFTRGPQRDAIRDVFDAVRKAEAAQIEAARAHLQSDDLQKEIADQLENQKTFGKLSPN